MNGYWKFHRKMLENPLFRDANALKIFLWILSSVDYKTGKMTTGRFIGAELLDMNPSTFRDALYRLRDKHKTILLHGNNRTTEIVVVNWVKYQSDEEGKRYPKMTTTGRQLDDTKNEAKTTKKSNQNHDEQENDDNWTTHTKEIKNKEEKKNNNKEEFLSFISLFNEKFQKNYHGTEDRYSKFTLRLKSFSLEQLLTAVTNLSKSEFHKGKNERNWSANPDFLLRSDEQIDNWINNEAKTKKQVWIADQMGYETIN